MSGDLVSRAAAVEAVKSVGGCINAWSVEADTAYQCVRMCVDALTPLEEPPLARAMRELCEAVTELNPTVSGSIPDIRRFADALAAYREALRDE